MKRYLTLCLLVLIAASCWPDEEPRNNTTIDYIRQTGRLWGVAELRLNEAGSVTFVGEKKSGGGLNLIMFDSKNKVTDSVTLTPGRSLSLSDGRHIFITYELAAIKDGRIVINVTDKFDARSFGDGIRQTKKTVTISPYKKEELPQQTN
jgi:hypothetical protein